MMGPLEWVFWISFAVIAYATLVYPILLVLLNAGFGRAGGRNATSAGEPAAPRTSVSILLPVHNEEQHLERRLDELTRILKASGLPGEIVVISDASTDRSVEIARQFTDRGVRIIEQPAKSGKAAALNAGAASSQSELLIFADARQRWADDALVRLVENFADANIGAVSGDLMLESAPGVLAGIGMYWRFEKWLRKQESRLGSQVGVTGAISAVRRPLFHPIPPGTLLDDVFWPIHVVLRGFRVIHDESAKAFDRLPEKSHDEFRRKVRTLAGNYQLLMLLPTAALFPWSNRVWWQWLSHKLMRLLAPWALLGMFVSSFLLSEIPFYQFLFFLQVIGYGFATLGMISKFGRAVRPLGTAASFLVLNAAAWLAFWIWVSGRAGTSWHKVQYEETYEDV